MAAVAGIGAVRGIGNQDLLARIAALFEQRADQQDAGQFAVRAGGGLQRDGVHAGDFGQRGFQARHHFHRALRQRLRLIGMRPGQPFDARHQFVDRAGCTSWCRSPADTCRDRWRSSRWRGA